MKFVVGLAAGVALAAAAYAYASRNEAVREAFEGVQADLRAGDAEALQARLEAGLAEVRDQVQQRFGPQGDWSAETADAASDAVETLEVAADDTAGTAATGAEERREA